MYSMVACFSCSHYWNDIVSLYPRSVPTFPDARRHPSTTSSLSPNHLRTLPEVSGLALSPLSARGTTCYCEKENPLWKSLKLLFQMSNWAKNRCIMGCGEFGAQPVWVPHWTQLGANQHWLDTEGLFFCVLLVSHVWTSSLPEQGGIWAGELKLLTVTAASLSARVSKMAIEDAWRGRGESRCCLATGVIK